VKLFVFQTGSWAALAAFEDRYRFTY